MQKEKSRFLLSCKAQKKPVNIQERRFGVWWKKVSGGREGCRKHHRLLLHENIPTTVLKQVEKTIWGGGTDLVHNL